MVLVYANNSKLHIHSCEQDLGDFFGFSMMHEIMHVCRGFYIGNLRDTTIGLH